MFRFLILLEGVCSGVYRGGEISEIAYNCHLDLMLWSWKFWNIKDQMVQKCLVGHNRRWVITLCVCRACGKVEGVWGLGRKHRCMQELVQHVRWSFLHKKICIKSSTLDVWHGPEINSTILSSSSGFCF